MATISDVMTPDPRTFEAGDTVAAAARAMADDDIGDVLVVEGGNLTGILTDRDIAIRVVAEGRDPQSTTVGDVCTRDLLTLTVNDSVENAAQVMGDHAIRRLPVVDDSGRPVGIVSLGDLAMQKDPESALAEISAAPADE